MHKWWTNQGLVDFETKWRITTGLHERGVWLLCNMIENKKRGDNINQTLTSGRLENNA